MMNTPEFKGSECQHRSSNLELFRVICMLLIVAHHYALPSDLVYGNLLVDLTSTKSLFMTILGAWGKTGINCFMMITGYFMCKSHISLRKFLKLCLCIYFYRLLLFSIFYIGGYETITAYRIFELIMPIDALKHNFVGCFLVFYLTIPFWNNLINNISERQHILLTALLLTSYTLLGSVPSFDLNFNYVSWFGVIYLVSSYIRLYPNPMFERRILWGLMTFTSVIIAIASILAQRFVIGERLGMGYFFVYDSNKIFPVIVAVCSFLWFRNMSIRYSKLINAFGAGTFGVLLIHANSDAMRTWLWKDTVDVIGHYTTMNTGMIALYSLVVVLLVFFICDIIDQLRMATLEKWFLRWYDNNLSVKANTWIDKLTSNKQII